MNYAYERVSTIKQDERRQELCMEGLRIDRKYIDKLSGKNADRPQLQKLKDTAKSGDHIYVEAISRLGRNVDDLRELCRYFKDRGVTVHFLKEGFDTGGSMYQFLLTILGAVAEMEREVTVERVREGVEKARKYGTKSGRPFGRPAPKIPDEFPKYYDMWQQDLITAAEFSKLLQVSRATLYRHIKQYEGR